MHASTESLLSYRDGLPLDAISASHIQHCAQCQSQVARFRAISAVLRDLPAPEAPPLDFDALHGRVARRHFGSGWWRGATALTACLFVAFSAVFLLRTPPQPDATEIVAADVVATTATALPSADHLAELQARSQRLEDALRRLPARPAVQNARMASAHAALEDQLALIDYGLTVGNDAISPQQQRRLWQGRVALMESLVELRQAEYRAVAL